MGRRDRLPRGGPRDPQGRGRAAQGRGLAHGGDSGRHSLVDFNLANAYGSDPARKLWQVSRDCSPRPSTSATSSSWSSRSPTTSRRSWSTASIRRPISGSRTASRPIRTSWSGPSGSARSLCVNSAWNPAHRAMRVLIRQDLADGLEAMGRSADARTVRERTVAGTRGDGAALFDAAVVSADNARLTGTYPTRLDARRLEERRRTFVRRAVGLIRQAVAEGFPMPRRLRIRPSWRSSPTARIPLGRRFPRRPRVPRRPFHGAALTDPTIRCKATVPAADRSRPEARDRSRNAPSRGPGGRGRRGAP